MYALVDSAATAAKGDGHAPPDVDVDLVQFKRQRVGPFSTVFDLGSGTTVLGVQGSSGASPPADFEALLRAVPLNIPFGGEIQLKFRFPVYEVTLHNARRHGPDRESDQEKWTFHVEGRTTTDVFSHGLTAGGVWGIVSTAGGELQVPWFLGGTHAHPGRLVSQSLQQGVGLGSRHEPRAVVDPARSFAVEDDQALAAARRGAAARSPEHLG